MLYNILMPDLDEVAQKIAQEERTKKAMKILMAKYDDWTKRYLLSVYFDSKIHDMYNALRSEANLSDKFSKVRDDTANRRLVVKYPNHIVYKFLDDVFAKKYGEDWASDKQTLSKVIMNEDLIQPWVIRRI